MLWSRRQFIRIVPLVAWSAGATRLARADDTRVDEKDPDAVAQDYRDDASKVDRARHPTFAAGQTCANCALFDGGPKDAWGGCSLFLGREVAAKGWCSAWASKPH